MSAPLLVPPPSRPHTYYVAGDHKERAGRSLLLTSLVNLPVSNIGQGSKPCAEHSVSGMTTELPCQESQPWAKTRAKFVFNCQPHLSAGLPCLSAHSHQSFHLPRRPISPLTLNQKPLPGLAHQPMQWTILLLPLISKVPFHRVSVGCPTAGSQTVLLLSRAPISTFQGRDWAGHSGAHDRG